MRYLNIHRPTATLTVLSSILSPREVIGKAFINKSPDSFADAAKRSLDCLCWAFSAGCLPQLIPCTCRCPKPSDDVWLDLRWWTIITLCPPCKDSIKWSISSDAKRGGRIWHMYYINPWQQMWMRGKQGVLVVLLYECQSLQLSLGEMLVSMCRHGDWY